MMMMMMMIEIAEF